MVRYKLWVNEFGQCADSSKWSSRVASRGGSSSRKDMDTIDGHRPGGGGGGGGARVQSCQIKNCNNAGDDHH
ncbi:hypothetical protein TYRP_006110 [Tyrophagus putrescentiae]|nr:hypothetical protein TYRP_006110 [Tyrophagus putrescentiae]